MGIHYKPAPARATGFGLYRHETWEQAIARVPWLKHYDGREVARCAAEVFEFADSMPGFDLVQVIPGRHGYFHEPVFVYRRKPAPTMRDFVAGPLGAKGPL